MDVLSTADLLAIHELYATYNHAIDAGDADAYCTCFTDDGVLHRSTAVLQGHEQLAAFARDVASRRLRHFVSNVVVDHDGSDETTGRAYVLVLRPDGGGLSIATAGSYRDLIRRADGRWRFAERRYETMT